MHHHLGYEQPERTGFGGLWEAVAEATETPVRTAGDVEFEPEVVATCEGASSARTRALIAAFRQQCCDVEVDVDAAA